jgi:toxin ParE1/3/4
MRGYTLSPAARSDLDAIWNYTVDRWGIARAERYILMIRDTCDEPAAGARLGKAIDDVRLGYRKLPVGSHILFYRVDRAGQIEVVRILHQRMDVPTHLPDDQNRE